MEEAKIVVVVQDGIVIGVHVPDPDNYDVWVADLDELCASGTDSNWIARQFPVSHKDLADAVPEAFSEVFTSPGREAAG